MSEPRKSRRRRQELEPLTYEEAASAPALTGLVSFLGLQPSDVAARQAARTAVLEQAERDSSSLPSSNSPSTIQRPPAPVGVSTTGPNGSVEGRGRLIELTSAGKKPDHNASAFNGVDVHRILDPATTVSVSTGVEIPPVGSSTTGDYQIPPVGASTPDQIPPVGLSGIPTTEESNSFDNNQIEAPPTGIAHGPVALSTTGQKTPLVTSTPAVEQIAPVVASTPGPISSPLDLDNVSAAPETHEAGGGPTVGVEYVRPVGVSTPTQEQVLPVVASTSGPISSPLDLDNVPAAPETQEARGAPTVGVEYVPPVGVSTPAQEQVLPVVASTSKPISPSDRVRVVPEPQEARSIPTLGVGHMRPVGLSTPGAFLPGVGRSAVYKASLAQDGHSLGEQAVYEVLWREGKPDKLRTEPEDLWAARYVSLGYAEVAAKARINKKSAKLNLQRLIEKQAIEVTSEYIKETSCPRTYRVLSYREIVDRRRRAGMVWVVRNKAVTFVTPDGIPLEISPLGTSTPGSDTPSGFTLGSAPRPGVLTPTPGIAHAATAPGVETPTHINREVFLDNLLERQNTTTTSFPRFDLVAQAMSQVAYADHNAVTQLVEDCSGIVPDVTAEEICEFVQEKSNIVAASSTIKNPIGFLLATVPKCFVGKPFLEHREQKRIHAEKLRLEAEAEAKRLETVAQQAVELITEPSSPEELKVRIRSEFIADPYRPLASYLSEDERAVAGRVWSAVRDRLQSLVNVQVFQTWFRPLKGFRYREGTLKVVVPVGEFMNLDKRYPDELNQAVARVREEVEGLAELNRLQFFDGSDFRV
ncbi:MAG: DnaA N-terminal domain [Acidobacteriaceae bacterium]|nr:DnaA N-terminal domain [Acidobacteriaceae bacterium]